MKKIFILIVFSIVSFTSFAQLKRGGSGRINEQDTINQRNASNDLYTTKTELKDSLALRIYADSIINVIRATGSTSPFRVASEQAVRDAIENINIAGQYVGSAATIATLPTQDVLNGDWAILTDDDGANLAGIYVFNGTTYSFAKGIPSISQLTNAQAIDKTSVLFGTTNGFQLDSAARVVYNTKMQSDSVLFRIFSNLKYLESSDTTLFRIFSNALYQAKGNYLLRTDSIGDLGYVRNWALGQYSKTDTSGNYFISTQYPIDTALYNSKALTLAQLAYKADLSYVNGKDSVILTNAPPTLFVGRLVVDTLGIDTMYVWNATQYDRFEVGGLSTIPLHFGRMSNNAATVATVDIPIAYTTRTFATYAGSGITANAATGTFTIVNSGIYNFEYFQSYADRDDDVYARLFVNNAAFGEPILHQVPSAGGASGFLYRFPKVNLTAGQTVQVRIAGVTADAIIDQNRLGIVEYFDCEQQPSAVVPVVEAMVQTLIGADGTNAGVSGVVPTPAATDNNNFLRGDGTWSTTNDVILTDVPPSVFAGRVVIDTLGTDTLYSWNNSQYDRFEAGGSSAKLTVYTQTGIPTIQVPATQNEGDMVVVTADGTTNGQLQSTWVHNGTNWQMIGSVSTNLATTNAVRTYYPSTTAIQERWATNAVTAENITNWGFTAVGAGASVVSYNNGVLFAGYAAITLTATEPTQANTFTVPTIYVRHEVAITPNSDNAYFMQINNEIVRDPTLELWLCDATTGVPLSNGRLYAQCTDAYDVNANSQTYWRSPKNEAGIMDAYRQWYTWLIPKSLIDANKTATNTIKLAIRPTVANGAANLVYVSGFGMAKADYGFNYTPYLQLHWNLNQTSANAANGGHTPTGWATNGGMYTGYVPNNQNRTFRIPLPDTTKDIYLTTMGLYRATDNTDGLDHALYGSYFKIVHTSGDIDLGRPRLDVFAPSSKQVEQGYRPMGWTLTASQIAGKLIRPAGSAISYLQVNLNVPQWILNNGHFAGFITENVSSQ